MGSRWGLDDTRRYGSGQRVAIGAASAATASVKLTGMGVVGDNWNAEASALNHLAKSLSITADATRQATFDRIWTRFKTGFEARNLMAYALSTGGSSLNRSITQPTNHYFAFGIYEALAAYAKLPGSMSGFTLKPRVLLHDATTGLGQVWERQTQFDPTRRGAPSTPLFFASSLALAPDATASDLEQACAGLRYLIAVSAGDDMLLTPVDGWAYNGGIYAAMDIRVLTDI